MKKVFAFLLAVSVLFSVPAFSLAEDEEEDPGLFTCGDCDYRLLEDGTAEIVEYTGLDAQVEIPAELDGFKVSGTGDEMAFPWYAHITGVVIPDSLTRIGRNPFIYCDALAAVTVSPGHPSLEVRDGVLFSKTDGRLICYPLTKNDAGYEIPAGTRSIGQMAFYACASLESVRIPDTVTEIEARAFYECPLLAGVTLPEGLAAIGDAAFYKCTALAGISIPDSVAAVGSNPFEGCSALEAVSVSPDHPALEVQGGALFSRADRRLICYPRACGQVTYEIPEGTETIGDFAFAGCALLKAVTIPEGLTTIGTSAFCWCENLEKVNIPKSVTSMDEYAFYGCGAVTITIPRGSEYIEYFEDQELKYREAD